MELNQFIGIGEVTHDVDLNETAQGHSVCNFNIRIIETFEVQGEQVQKDLFIRVVAWKQLAVKIHPRLKKGTKVLVIGKIVFREFESKGERKKTFEVSAIDIQVQE